MLLTLFGLGMSVLGVIMLIRPISFASGIAEFANKSWFHTFEVTSRCVLGVLFIFFSETANRPLLYLILGLLLCFVSVFLIFIGSERHKQFAMKTVKLGRLFRPMGVFALVLGWVLIYFDHI